MNSRARGAPWRTIAIVAILTKAASAFCQVRAAVSAAYSKEFLLRNKVEASFLLESATVLAQTFDVNRIAIFRIVRWRKSIFSQPERLPLLHNSCQFLTSQFELVRHTDWEAEVALFARAREPLENFKLPTAVTHTTRLLFVLLTGDPLEAAKQAVKGASYQAAVVQMKPRKEEAKA